MVLNFFFLIRTYAKGLIIVEISEIITKNQS